MEKVIKDYVEGWYDKDTTRLKSAMHPQLVKQGMVDQPGGIRKIDLQGLLDVTPQYGGTDGDGRVVDIEIFEQQESIATAKVTSNSYVDYLHMVKMNDRWQILNVLWENKASSSVELTPQLKKALEIPLKDYVEGWYDKDTRRVAHGLHPNLAKRSINGENPEMLDQYTFDSLLEIVPQYGGPGGEERILEIEILDVQKNMASVKVTSNAFIDYIHLGCFNSEWKILNVLWSWK